MTSVEWLFKQLWETPKDKFNWFAILKMAEEMHKKEIINAVDGYPLDKRHLDGEDYYNEVFKDKS